MLRSEHVIARLSRGRILPLPARARRPARPGGGTRASAAYAGHVGGPRSHLERPGVREEELGPRLDARRDSGSCAGSPSSSRSVRGPPPPRPTRTPRTRVFELAAALPEPPAEEAGLLGAPTRDDVLSRVAAETGMEDPASSCTQTGREPRSWRTSRSLPGRAHRPLQRGPGAGRALRRPRPRRGLA